MTEIKDVGADPIVDAVVTGVDEVAKNADRLGLKWELTPATITGVTSDALIGLQLDCDVVPTNAVSLIGPVTVGMRVMVMLVPPTGRYIVGWVGMGAQVPGGTLGLRTATSAEGAANATPIKDFGLGDIIFTAILGRRYHIKYTGRMTSAAVTQAGDAQIRIAASAVNVGNSTVIGASHNYLPTAGGIGQSQFVVDAFLDCPGDVQPGTWYVAPFFVRTSGGSSVTVNQSTGGERTFSVTDIGANINRTP